MAEEGSKAVYTETEVDTLIAAEATARDAAIAVEATARNAAIAVEATARDAAIAVEAAARAAAIVAHAANYGLHTKLIVKSADETVNNSGELQDDDELLFAVAANEVWAFILIPEIDSSQAADFTCDFSIPSGAHIFGYYNCFGPSLTVSATPIIIGSGPTIGCYDQPLGLMIVLGVIANGSTPGNLQFRWSQHEAEESDTIVKANSCILAWKLA